MLIINADGKTVSEMVISLREMASMKTEQPDSVLVKKTFLRDVADKLEELDERIAIMAESEFEGDDLNDMP